jgi:hypothetical protein
MSVIFVIIGTVFGKVQDIRIDSGTIYIKKLFDTESVPVSDSTALNSGDTLYIEPDQKASCYIRGNYFLFLEYSCKIALDKQGDKITLILLNGQIFFNNQMTTVEENFGIYAEECYFIPMGTAAAVKIITDVGPSVAVLVGNVQMKSLDGLQRNVVQGQFCSYHKNMKQFSEIKTLPEKTSNYLQSLIPPESDQENMQSSNDPVKPASQRDETDLSGTDTGPGQEKTDKSPDSESLSDEGKEDDMAKVSETEDDLADKTGEDSDKKGKDNKPTWGISAGMVTVDDAVWTRLALSVDIPVWRFGICFDLELYLDENGNFTNKGWNFDSWRDASESLLGKIRYIRLNHQGDPLFIKIGGLDNVTLGYGFIVDRFTNMLNYPGEKLLGLQFDLNNIGPIGISWQTLIPDFMEFSDEGGLIASRIAFIPFKALSVPLINGFSIGGTFAIDINQYAPARRWDYTLNGYRWDKDEDNITDSTYLFEIFNQTSYYDSIVNLYKSNGDYDARVEHKDQWAKDKYDMVMIAGGDFGIPIINTKLLSLVLYGQMGMLINDEKDSDEPIPGWGFGVPGIRLQLAPFWATAEYRHIRDKFLPGYFNTYYLKDRIVRSPSIKVKEEMLSDTKLNGVFAQCGFNILDVLILDGRGQYMASKKDSTGSRKTDINFDATLSFGDLLLSKIPKINLIQLFYYQTDIDGNFFKKSLTTHWGYTLGLEVTEGASVIWKTDYGWVKDKNGKWIDNKVVTISAGFTF